jgi:Lrp/AsnC family transcriptional regulator, regulator for asnA, asnC and gidA
MVPARAVRVAVSRRREAQVAKSFGDRPGAPAGRVPFARAPRFSGRGHAEDAAGARTFALDEVSKRIIEELQQDGRRSYAALAKSVGLSEAAVRQRVQRLLDAGVMQIVAVTDPTTVGFSRQAMIGVRADGDIREVAERLSKLPELEYVVACAGSFDLLVELVCEDDEHLLEVLNESVRTVPGVRETETFVYLRLIKQTYGWGTR